MSSRIAVIARDRNVIAVIGKPQNRWMTLMKLIARIDSVQLFCRLLAVLLVAQELCLVSPAQTGTPPETAFTESAASKLLNQVAEGLHGHSPKKMLQAFDLSRMNGGAVFKEQITAFFNQYESIRVHFKLVEVNDNTATINAEMDQTPRSAITPPQHKSMELQFTAEKEADGWKFVDVRPRGFFN